ncbi:MAG: sigma-70 family RNA polymerase sigma factor [Cyclobacteriaceae bacterium]
MNSSKENFLKVVEKHKGIILSLCNVYYDSLDDQLDTRQDVILQLWKSFASFRGDSQISTWVYKVSLNTILSKIKKERREPFKESINTNHENKLTKINSDDDIQLLHQIIRSLKELDKALIILHLEGYKNWEIGEILNLSPSNVSTRMNRIKMHLKSKFSSYVHEHR